MRWDAFVDLLEYISATVSCHVGLKQNLFFYSHRPKNPHMLVPNGLPGALDVLGAEQEMSGHADVAVSFGP